MKKKFITFGEGGITGLNQSADQHSSLSNRPASMFNKKRHIAGSSNRYFAGMRNIALNSAFATSVDTDSVGDRRGTRNVGTILNFTKTDGINDQTDNSNFRKWTGLPETTRVHKDKLAMNKFALRQDKVVADHRTKMNTLLDPIEHKKF